MLAQPVPYLTAQEYLELEGKAEYKSEYFRGQMWPLGGVPYGMAGGRPEHNRIASSFLGELYMALKGQCQVFNSDQRIRVAPDGLYTYPDCSVVCGEPVFAEKDTLVNPRILIEVLSKTTESNDRGIKLAQYVKLESLEEYVLVSQTEPRVERFRRQSNCAWLWHEYTGLDATVQFQTVDCAIRPSDVYAGVEFDQPSAAGIEPTHY
jgi:Uma2 family endonuclease